MTSDEFFNKLLRSIQNERSIGSAGYEPVFYLVYPLAKTFRVQKEIFSPFKTLLKEKGHKPIVFNVYDEVWKILESCDDWKEMCQTLKQNPSRVSDLDPTIRELVDSPSNSALLQRLLEVLKKARGCAEEKPVILVTGMEVLHRITRPGTIEGRLTGEFAVPTIFFYPGKMEGGAGLSFLGFYTVDSNYRSEHFDLSEILK